MQFSKLWRLCLHASGGLAFRSFAMPSAMAQAAWPERPIKFVVPYPPAALTDLLAGQVQLMFAAELQRIQATPEFRDQSTRFGMEPLAPQSPEQFSAMIVAEQPRWAQAIKESGAKVD